MIAEIYSLEVRGSGEGIASVANWGTNLLVSVTFLTLVNTIGQGVTFWIYVAVGVIAVAFVYTQRDDGTLPRGDRIRSPWKRLRRRRRDHR